MVYVIDLNSIIPITYFITKKSFNIKNGKSRQMILLRGKATEHLVFLYVSY